MDLNTNNVMIVARSGQLLAKIVNLRVARDIEDLHRDYIALSKLQSSIWHAPEGRIGEVGRDKFEVDIYSWELLMYQYRRVGQGMLHTNPDKYKIFAFFMVSDVTGKTWGGWKQEEYAVGRNCKTEARNFREW